MHVNSGNNIARFLREACLVVARLYKAIKTCRALQVDRKFHSLGVQVKCVSTMASDERNAEQQADQVMQSSESLDNFLFGQFFREIKLNPRFTIC